MKFEMRDMSFTNKLLGIQIEKIRQKKTISFTNVVFGEIIT